MNTNRYTRHFYSTPHYTPTEQVSPIFAVRSLHVLPRHPHSRARPIGAAHRTIVSRPVRGIDPAS